MGHEKSQGSPTAKHLRLWNIRSKIHRGRLRHSNCSAVGSAPLQKHSPRRSWAIPKGIRTCISRKREGNSLEYGMESNAHGMMESNASRNVKRQKSGQVRGRRAFSKKRRASIIKREKKKGKEEREKKVGESLIGKRVRVQYNMEDGTLAFFKGKVLSRKRTRLRTVFTGMLTSLTRIAHCR